MFCFHLVYLLSTSADAPLFVPVPWSVGTSKYPIISEPFRLTCPLKGNPPATYSWRKFKSLDMAEPLEVTADLTFTNDGQTWHVESYSPQDNGLYACYASNSLGMTEYHNPAVFFLSATGTQSLIYMLLTLAYLERL